jgi:hypothetical protein
VNPDLQRIARAIEQLVAAQHKGAWDYVSGGAVIATLLVLIWYTIETYKLRVEAQKQNHTSAMPVVEFGSLFRHWEIYMDGQPRPTSTEFLCIRNIGVGPALNIKLRLAKWGDEQATYVHTAALGAGKEQAISIMLKGVDGPERIIHNPDFLQRHCKGESTTAGWITYCDVSGIPYQTKFTVDFDTLERKGSVFILDGVERLT